MDQETEKQPELEGVPMDSSDMGSMPKYDMSKISIYVVVAIVLAGMFIALLVFFLSPIGGGKSIRKTNETTNNQGSGGNSGGGDSGGSGSSDGGSDDDDDDITDDGTVEGKIQSILASAKKITKKYAADYDYVITDVDDYSVDYEFEKGISTSLEKSIGFVIKPKDEKDYKLAERMRDGIANNANLQKDIEDKMKSFGLAKSEKVADYWSDARFENSDGYICIEGFAGEFYIVCGHTSWLSNKQKEFIKALAVAYAKAEKIDYSSLEGFIFLDASLDKIKDSKTKPYQTIEVDLGDAGGDFYRKGADSEWIYAFGGQQAPDCEEFNTTELKAAFEGGVCWHWGEDPPRQDTVKK